MTTPALLGLNIGLAKKKTLRDMLARVDERLGGESRMVEEANKSSAAYWEFQKLRVRVEPKELSVTHDNSPEALLEALEAHRRGEQVQFIDAEVIEDAQFEALPVRQTLWSAKIISQCV